MLLENGLDRDGCHSLHYKEDVSGVTRSVRQHTYRHVIVCDSCIVRAWDTAHV